MRARDWGDIKHFTPIEFRHPERMGYEFLLWLDKLRDACGFAFVITSDYRSPLYNKAVGGAKDSAHSDEICQAIDIGKRPRENDPNWNFSRWQIITKGIILGCQRFGLYSNGSLHLDRTEHIRPAPRIWTAVDNPA
jgi:hypothetical protein